MDQSEFQIISGLRTLAAESPEPAAVATRALLRYRSKANSVRQGPWLVAVAVVLALVFSIGYFVPALTEAIADAPLDNWVIHASGLGNVADRVTGVSYFSDESGITLHLVGGYADSARSVLFVDLPTARNPDVLIGQVYLTDQFGQAYKQRGSVQDLASHHAAVIFEPLRGPATIAGARLTMRIDALEKAGGGTVRGPWELRGVLVEQTYHQAIPSPQDGFINGQRIHFASVVAVPYGVELRLSFPGASAADVTGRISDRSPKGRAAVVLRLVTSSAAVDPYMCEYDDTAGGPGFDCLWQVAPADYTLVVDYRGSSLNRTISVPKSG